MTSALRLQLLVKITELYLCAVRWNLDRSISAERIKPLALAAIIHPVANAETTLKDISTEPRPGLEAVDIHRLASHNQHIWTVRCQMMRKGEWLSENDKEERLLFGLRLFTLFGAYLGQARNYETAQKSGVLLEWFEANMKAIQHSYQEDVSSDDRAPGVSILPMYVRDHIQQLTHGLSVSVATSLVKEVMKICPDNRRNAQEISLLSKILFSDRDDQADLDIDESDQRFMIDRILSLLNIDI